MENKLFLTEKSIINYIVQTVFPHKNIEITTHNEALIPIQVKCLDCTEERLFKFSVEKTDLLARIADNKVGLVFGAETLYVDLDDKSIKDELVKQISMTTTKAVNSLIKEAFN